MGVLKAEIRTLPIRQLHHSRAMHKGFQPPTFPGFRIVMSELAERDCHASCTTRTLGYQGWVTATHLRGQPSAPVVEAQLDRFTTVAASIHLKSIQAFGYDSSIPSSHTDDIFPSVPKILYQPFL